MKNPLIKPVFTDIRPGVLLIIFGNVISEKLNGMIRFFCKKIQQEVEDRRLLGLSEWVPAYCSVMVLYDPFTISPRTLIIYCRHLIDQFDENSNCEQNEYTVPVCYDQQFAPDMQNVIDHTGLSWEEIKKIHQESSYLVYMLGFLPGFLYLGDLNPSLFVPRLSVPRAKIPAGSVAIGGQQTGVYPLDSPGGWQIIGKTPLKLYDPMRNPPVIFQAGDRIRFKSISTELFFDLEKQYKLQEKKDGMTLALKQTYIVSSGIRILKGGLLTTIQDGGRKGFQKEGFCVSGVMDRLSYIIANMLVGNSPDAAVLETTMIGPEICFILSCDIAVTGADQQPVVDNVPIPLYQVVHVKAGSILRMSTALSGIRSYIAFSGGIIVPRVLNSFSTSLKYKLGGYSGRKLESDDEIAIGQKKRLSCKSMQMHDYPQSIISRIELLKTVSAFSESGRGHIIHVIKGPQYDLFSKEGIKTFKNSAYTVSTDSDRMGYRCIGPSVESNNGTDIISDGIIFGSIQITASGMPIIMMADHQTTGGYAKIATVVESDLPILAQCVPGSILRFQFISQEKAFELIREQAIQLSIIQELLIDGGW